MPIATSPNTDPTSANSINTSANAGSPDGRPSAGGSRTKTIALIVATLLVVAAAGAFLIGPPPEKGTTASAAAIAESGAETLVVNDPIHDRPFDVLVWEPAAGASNGELVVISHGFSGHPTSYSSLAKQLAAEGYKVVAPTHPDIAGLESGNPDLDPFVLRPRHLSLAIDAISEQSGAPSSITVIGHSLGGYSALRLAGATPSIGAEYTSHCLDTDDALLCSDRLEKRVVADATQADFADTRIDKIVLLAPGYGPLFGAAQLDVDIPITIVEASDDSELPGDQVAEFTNRLPEGSASTEVVGGHYAFMRSCTATEATSVPQFCNDPAGTDRAEISAHVVSVIAGS